MSSNVKYSNRLKIIRPFLYFKKKDLKYVTKSYFKTFIKDPSNEDEKFLRVRVRKYKRDMEREGLDTRKIIKTIDNLVSASQALNYYKNKALLKHASFVSKNRCLINKQIFSEEAGEIIFKFFSDILSLISETYYPPRSKKIINLIGRLKKDKFAKSTLGGCIVEEKDNFISISKEFKMKKIQYQLKN
jgi:tRNA(Ile)-lysidine synthase